MTTSAPLIEYSLILGGGYPIPGLIGKSKTGEQIPAHQGFIVVSRQKTGYNEICGARDNEELVGRSGLISGASQVFIMWDDGEVDPDAVSVRCLEMVSKYTREDRIVPCYLLFRHSSSVIKYRERLDAINFENNNLSVEIIDLNAYFAGQLLASNSLLYPNIDCSIDKEGNRTQGIGPDSSSRVHLLVIGTTDQAFAVAEMGAHICHFPNFRNGGLRTIISVVGSDGEQLDKYVSNHRAMFDLSHYTRISYDSPEGSPIVKVHYPEENLGDFLDVEWRLVDVRMDDISRAVLDSIGQSQESVTMAICYPSLETNANITAELQTRLGRLNIPTYVYGDSSSLHIVPNCQPFSYYLFGYPMIEYYEQIQDTVARGRRVNGVYCGLAGKPDNELSNSWKSCGWQNKQASIACANALYIRARSFKCSECEHPSLPEGQIHSFNEVEHRRWVQTTLLLGYSSAKTEDRKDWASRMDDNDASIRQNAVLQYRSMKQQGVHLDITPYEDLPKSEKDKDRIIVDNIPYILLGTKKSAI